VQKFNPGATVLQNGNERGVAPSLVHPQLRSDMKRD